MLASQVAEPFVGHTFGSKATFGHTDGLQNVVQPTIAASKEQQKLNLKTALAEIEELKQSQRVIEISLAKQIEEKEALKHALTQSELKNAVGLER
jgi:hypothetical protein